MMRSVQRVGDGPMGGSWEAHFFAHSAAIQSGLSQAKEKEAVHWSLQSFAQVRLTNVQRSRSSRSRFDSMKMASSGGRCCCILGGDG